MNVKKKVISLALAALLSMGVVITINNVPNVLPAHAAVASHQSVEEIISDVYNSVIPLDSNNIPQQFPGNISSWFIIRDSRLSDSKLSYGTYTVAYEVRLSNLTPTKTKRKISFHYVKDPDVVLDKNPTAVPTEDDYGTVGTLSIPANAKSAFTYMLTKFKIDENGAKIISSKSYDHVPSSPYTVKQIKRNVLSKFYLSAKNRSSKRPTYTNNRNKPKFKLSHVKFTEDLEINMFGKRNISVLKKKGKLPVDDYKLKATITINNFKPNKKTRKYDLMNRDGAAIAEVRVPSNSNHGKAKINLEVHLTPKEYLVTIK